MSHALMSQETVMFTSTQRRQEERLSALRPRAAEAVRHISAAASQVAAARATRAAAEASDMKKKVIRKKEHQTVLLLILEICDFIVQ